MTIARDGIDFQDKLYDLPKLRFRIARSRRDVLALLQKGIDMRRQHLAQESLFAVEIMVEPRSRAGACIGNVRSEEHTSELQSLMRISYAVLCVKKKKKKPLHKTRNK